MSDLLFVKRHRRRHHHLLYAVPLPISSSSSSAFHHRHGRFIPPWPVSSHPHNKIHPTLPPSWRLGPWKPLNLHPSFSSSYSSSSCSSSSSWTSPRIRRSGAFFDRHHDYDAPFCSILLDSCFPSAKPCALLPSSSSSACPFFFFKDGGSSSSSRCKNNINAAACCCYCSRFSARSAAFTKKPSSTSHSNSLCANDLLDVRAPYNNHHRFSNTPSRCFADPSSNSSSSFVSRISENHDDHGASHATMVPPVISKIASAPNVPPPPPSRPLPSSSSSSTCIRWNGEQQQENASGEAELRETTLIRNGGTDDHSCDLDSKAKNSNSNSKKLAMAYNYTAAAGGEGHSSSCNQRSPCASYSRTIKNEEEGHSYDVSAGICRTSTTTGYYKTGYPPWKTPQKLRSSYAHDDDDQENGYLDLSETAKKKKKQREIATRAWSQRLTVIPVLAFSSSSSAASRRRRCNERLNRNSTGGWSKRYQSLLHNSHCPASSSSSSFSMATTTTQERQQHNYSGSSRSCITFGKLHHASSSSSAPNIVASRHHCCCLKPSSCEAPPQRRRDQSESLLTCFDGAAAAAASSEHCRHHHHHHHREIRSLPTTAASESTANRRLHHDISCLSSRSARDWPAASESADVIRRRHPDISCLSSRSAVAAARGNCRQHHLTRNSRQHHLTRNSTAAAAASSHQSSRPIKLQFLPSSSRRFDHTSTNATTTVFNNVNDASCYDRSVNTQKVGDFDLAKPNLHSTAALLRQLQFHEEQLERMQPQYY